MQDAVMALGRPALGCDADSFCLGHGLRLDSLQYRRLCEHLLVVSPPPDDDQVELNTADPSTLVVDLNSPFASIEQHHDPNLRGRPLAIAAYATNAATTLSSSRKAPDLRLN